jgi:hypothetical protein
MTPAYKQMPAITGHMIFTYPNIQFGLLPCEFEQVICVSVSASESRGHSTCAAHKKLPTVRHTSEAGYNTRHAKTITQTRKSQAL